MSPWTAAALGMVLGLVLGVVLVLLLRGRTGRGAPPEPDPEPMALPLGVAEVLAAVRTGGLVVDRAGRVVVTTSAAPAFGLVRSSELVDPQLRRLAAAVLQDKVIRETELDLKTGPFGTGPMLLGARVAAIRDDLAIMIIEDRTQARRVEEVRRDFVVNVSHELKTPVGGLSLLAEAVEDAAEDPVAVRRFARRMRHETHRLSRLVNEIVDLSRLQATDLMTELVIVDVARCAHEAVEHTRLVAGARRITAAATTPREGLRVYGEAELITTAIRNLVTNAIAYSDDGTSISVVTRRTGDVVEVAVTDQGHGIPVADRERIFERFYRVDPARSRATGGTGLGLSIVKHVCVNHGGEVTVWSHEGHGSTFTMRLPGVVDDDRPIGSPAPPTDRRPGPLASPDSATSLRSAPGSTAALPGQDRRPAPTPGRPDDTRKVAR
jgi:two-component system, OmpR family, sensor histidine kinase SenX3